MIGRLLFCAALWASTAAWGAELPPPSGPTAEDYAAAVAGKAGAVGSLLAKLPTFNDPDGRQFYIFEGDLAYTEPQLRGALAAQRKRVEARAKAANKGKAMIATPELKLELSDKGKRRRWGWKERALTYAVDKASFAVSPTGTYDRVVQSLEAAGTEWEAVCATCKLTIRHRADFDGAIDKTKVTFIVRYNGGPQDDIALAFFPADPADQRTLWVFSRYTVTSFDPVGVFRHELGHVLGYAHEHLGEASGCVQSADKWLPITAYTQNSVMHYVCGSEGSLDLAITPCDREGHAHTYSAADGVDPGPVINGACKVKPG